ncbi:tetratricopeptide repeat protein [Xanthovirga aplysinae]|uniref:tetratricopeptide repeat protein n=1 Tax=Xanthovirga aplysinae TaxID=2529853 RepID=UPI0012BC1256|nr:tetratricopeptide repeat protein [Xanthovirga aplysinae]MTI30041.1 tetratricopeptide repeat protein [Xanthovirga aplysinae]
MGWKGTKLRFFLLFLFLSSYCISHVAVGQRSKRVKKDRDLKERDYLQAEFFFTEGEKYYILEDYSKAYIFFQKAADFNPTNAAVEFKLAETLANMGDYDNALKHAHNSLNLDDQNKYYYLLCAELYSQKGEFKEAGKLYEQMIRDIPGTDEYLFDLATIYLYQENYPEVLKIMNKAEGIFGKNENITLQKQKIYIQSQKIEEAIREGDELIQAFPDEERFVIRQSDLLISNNKLDEALPYLNQLIDKTNSPEAHIHLAEIYTRKGESEKAESHMLQAFESPELAFDLKLQVFSQCIRDIPHDDKKKFCLQLAGKLEEHHSDNANTFAVLGDLYMTLGDKKSAKQKYLKAIDLDDSQFRVWQNLLLAEMEQGEYQLVKEHSQKALELFPNQASVYYYNGSAQLLEKNYQEAVYAFEAGKDLSLEDKELLSVFYSQLGDAYNGLKDYKKSDASYEAALENNSNNYYVLNNYSYFLSLRGEKLDLAREMSERLIRDNPENSTYLDTYAWVLYKSGQFKEARKYLEKAMKGEVSGTIIEHYGDTLYKLGEIEMAVQQWKKAKALNDGHSNLLDKKIEDRKLYEE